MRTQSGVTFVRNRKYNIVWIACWTCGRSGPIWDIFRALSGLHGILDLGRCPCEVRATQNDWFPNSHCDITRNRSEMGPIETVTLDPNWRIQLPIFSIGSQERKDWKNTLNRITGTVRFHQVPKSSNHRSVLIILILFRWYQEAGGIFEKTVQNGDYPNGCWTSRAQWLWYDVWHV